MLGCRIHSLPISASFLQHCLIGLSVFITVYYHYLQDPTFHQNAYALSHRLHRLQKHVRHGVHAASVSLQDRGEAHVGDVEDRAQVSG